MTDFSYSIEGANRASLFLARDPRSCAEMAAHAATPQHRAFVARAERRQHREQLAVDPCSGHGPYAAPAGAPVCGRCGYPAGGTLEVER